MESRTVSEGRLQLLLRSPSFRLTSGFICFVGAYYFAFALTLAFSHLFAAPFWLPDTALLCALLLVRPRNWWIFILGTLPIRLFATLPSQPAGFLLCTFVIDSAKGVLVAAALRRFLKQPPRLQSIRDFGIFCVFAVLLVPACAAFGGAGLNLLRGRLFLPTWQAWFLGDALTHAVLTPAILFGLCALQKGIKRPSLRHSLEYVLVAAGLIWTVQLSFSSDMNGMDFPESCFYAPIPLLFWAAIRFGMGGASGAVAILTLLSTQAAFHRQGPFYGKSPEDAVLILQEFLLFRAVPLYLVAILMQQKDEADQSRRESEQRFRIMADTAPVLIWMAGTDKLCDFFNHGWLNFTGRTLEQELGNGWADGVHPEDIVRCLKIYNASFDARQPFEMEYRLRRYDGQYRWILDRGVPRYGLGGEFMGYIGVLIDLTDRKRVEEARQRLVHASRLAVVGEFTAMIVHDLNQPLSATVLNVDAAKCYLDAPVIPVKELREILADIRADSFRAGEAVRHIRNLVKRHEMEMNPIDVNTMVSEVAQMVKNDVQRRRVKLHTDFSAPVATVRGDVVHLQQVVLNLIANGMDAMKDNPESDRHLFVTTAAGVDGYVEIAVKDTGIGIRPENLTHVFESFFTTKPDGMGMGLSIAHSIIQLHSGRLWVENNKDGKGTTFRFILPTVMPEAPKPSAPKREANA